MEGEGGRGKGRVAKGEEKACCIAELFDKTGSDIPGHSWLEASCLIPEYKYGNFAMEVRMWYTILTLINVPTKQMTNIYIFKISNKGSSKLILRIQRLESKQCRSR